MNSIKQLSLKLMKACEIIRKAPISGGGLSIKLRDCWEKDLLLCELFIV
jgi:DNA gyrase/topoisomerase IV subunit B